MSWLIDGSNLLGGRRESDEAKRELLRQLARFARARRARVTCYFDGPEPPSFGKNLGGVTAVFSGPRPADALIAERVGKGGDWKVVTSDRGIAARVGGRRVTVMTPSALLREIEQIADDEPAATGDWDAYFSDPTNRNVF